MITDEEIVRINELYKKAKEGTLTAEEKDEQASLRGKYIASIKDNLKAQLDNTKVINPDGTVVDLKKAHDKLKKLEQ